MKKLIYLLLFTIIGFSANAQVPFSNYGELGIEEGTVVSIKGNLNTYGTATIYNAGVIYITDSINNDADTTLFDATTSSYETGVGKVIFNGTSTQVISSTNGGIAFSKITINNNDTLKLETSIKVSDSLFLQSGNINLNGNDISLESFNSGGVVIHAGTIYGENNTNNIFGDNGEISVSDAIIDTNVTTDVANLGMEITYSQQINNLYISRKHNSFPEITDTSISRNFSVLIDGETGPNVDILKLKYLEKDKELLTNTSESDFKIWYKSDNQGSIFEKIPSTCNTTANTVTGTNPIQLSAGIYTISDAVCDELPEINIPDTLFVCEGDNISLKTNTILDSTITQIYWSSNTIDLTNNNTVNNHILNINWNDYQNNNLAEIYLFVIDENGCENFDTTIIKIKAKPQLSLSNTTPTACAMQEINFFAPAGMTEYLWDFGDNTATSNIDSTTHSFVNEGTYTVTLRVDSVNGCYNTATRDIIVHPLPTASFIPQNACVGENVDFENTSVSNHNGINIYYSLWDFGDSSTDSLGGINTASHIYSAPTIYTVGLQVFNAGTGCSDSISHQITVSPQVYAQFTALSEICLGDTLYITNDSVAIGNTYNWNFGDGTSATTYDINSNTQHLFTQAGTYNITLLAQSGSNCNDTISHQVIVHPAAVASFSVNNVCLNQTSVFTNNSTPTTGSTYQWSFDDGNTSTLTNPTNLYSATGNYNIELVVTTQYACTDTATQIHNVNPLPTADFTVNNACFGDTSFFTNTSINNAGNTYYWNFGDNTTATSNSLSPDVNTIYANNGNYTVTLIAENNFACTDTVQHTAVIDSIPQITLQDTTATCTGSILLTPGNTGSNFIWSTGENTQNITVTSDGNYTVTVTYPATGCTNSKTTQVLLNSDVIVNLGGNQTVCDSLVLDAGYYYTYNWSTSENTQQITVNTTGTYAVTVTDVNSCIGYDTVDITVNYSPIVNLGNDTTVCEQTQVILDAQNIGANYIWNSGETSQTISVINSGSYTVTVTDNNGCSTVAEPVFVQINENPTYPFTTNSIFACNSLVIDAQNSGSSYLWNTNETTQTIETDTSGLFVVEITNAFNCSITDSINVDMNYINQVNIGNDTTICEGNYVTLNQNDTSTTNTYIWNNGSTNQQLQVASTGLWWVTKYSTNGCTSSDTVSITVNPTPTFDLGDDLYLCSTNGFQLSSPITTENYNWTNNGNTVSVEQTLTIDETGTYALELTNSFGCSYSDTITINATPFESTPQFLAKSDLKVGDTVQFINLTYPEPTSYHWNFGDGISSTESDPMHTYYMAGTFNVVFEAIIGNCSSTIVKPITVTGYNKYYLMQSDSAIHYNEIIDFVSAKVYPNPNKGSFNLEFELTQKTDIIIVFFDMQGRVISNNKIKDRFYLYKEYNYSNLKPGMYFMKVLAGGKNKVFKIVVN